MKCFARRSTGMLLVVAAGAMLGASAAAGQTLRPNVEKPGVIRVCADPDNLPLSNDKGEGLENKIAELIGEAWNSQVEYAWWPVRRGYFGRALNGRYCDLAITAPTQLDMAATTKAYFRSAYVIVYRKDSGLTVTTLDDPALKTLKIGVNLLNADAENTPPAMALSAHGVVGNLVGFPTFYSEGGARPDDIMKAVYDKSIDLAIVWGPLAGYYAREAPTELVMVPLEYDSVAHMPFAFDFGIAVRRSDRPLRDSLQTFLDAHAAEVQNLLKQFGIPTLPIVPDSSKADASP